MFPSHITSFYFVGVKATYLLAVSFLEIIRFSSNGGILNGGSNVNASRSAFCCVFEYLKTPNLLPAVSQCLTAIVHRAFETAVSWLVCSLFFTQLLCFVSSYPDSFLLLYSR